MNSIQKIIYLFIIILCLIFCINTNISFSASIESDIKGFKATTSTAPGSVTGLKEVVKKFLVALRAASILLLVIVIATSGVRYIVATVNLKGEIKKNAFAIVLGLMFIFGASYFASFLIKVFGK